MSQTIRAVPQPGLRQSAPRFSLPAPVVAAPPSGAVVLTVV
jgi:hypothetical protein